jgi:hypothetical protein
LFPRATYLQDNVANHVQFVKVDKVSLEDVRISFRLVDEEQVFGVHSKEGDASDLVFLSPTHQFPIALPRVAERHLAFQVGKKIFVLLRQVLWCDEAITKK